MKGKRAPKKSDGKPGMKAMEGRAALKPTKKRRQQNRHKGNEEAKEGHEGKGNAAPSLLPLPSAA